MSAFDWQAQTVRGEHHVSFQSLVSSCGFIKQAYFGFFPPYLFPKRGDLEQLTPNDPTAWEANVGFIRLIRAKPSTYGSSDSKNLPGCPSPTDSEVKRKQLSSVGELLIEGFASSFIVFLY